MPTNIIEYQIVKPEPLLSNFVESYWMLVNHSEAPQEIVVLPDGRVDLFFSVSASESYHVTLMGLDTDAGQTTFVPGTRIFAVSFKLPAIEYLLKINIAPYLNSAHNLPIDFWGFSAADLQDFDGFCKKVSNTMMKLLDLKRDERKLQLFDLIYSSNGSITVKELSAKICWNSRQINRYFNQWFGISLKAYCNILRFRASFQHVKEGRLFPQESYADQSHFIKEVKKHAGVAPSALSRNKNDRFIQFSLLKKK